VTSKPRSVHRKSHARILERIERIHGQNVPTNIWPDNRCDRKYAMERKLKLATWNANGLAKCSLEVKAFILSQDIDILLVSETHFTNKSYLRILGYTLYHAMHPHDKGGTVLIIRSSIKHYEIDKHQRDFLQATSIMIETWNGCITISAVHSPCNKEWTIYNLPRKLR